MLYSLLLVAATALTSVSAQQYNYSTSGPLTINVTQVPYSLRQSWCVGEKENCPPICGGSVTAGGNECDPMTLNYTCTCASGAKPNLTDYLNTIPNYVCIQWRINCVANHPNDAGAQEACHSVICGTKNIKNESSTVAVSASGGLAVPLTSSASPSQSTSMGSMSTSASATSASASATHSGLAAAVKIGGEYGTGALALGMLAAFGLGI